ncbi:carbohydrate ABC transporter permease [Cryobacterium sp. TMT4-31]|uniref:carbohydrate ABC transporter permease n=1 Tax=Cryobacterium sp. TMT4-31 TaxID=1259259 RepID=UPI00106A7DDC|nr:sugar ABC transporter permease [Cryobacterium sp. TMT4-31]TFC90058.1 sugar ABC transporter permease [Cryobacterium sp. TMT4-31]
MTTATFPLPQERQSSTPGLRPSRRSRNSKGSLRDGLSFIAPFMLVYALFLLYPVVQAFFMSGFNWDLLSPNRIYIGLDNYTRMLWGRDIIWSAGHEWVSRLIVLLIAGGSGYFLAMRRNARFSGAAVAAGGLILVSLLGFHPSPDGAWNDPGFWIALKNTLAFTIISTPLLIGLGLLMAVVLHNQRRGGGIYRAIFFLPYVLPISAVTLIWSYLLNPDRGLIAGFLGWFGLDGIAFLSDPNLAMPAIIATTVWWSVGFNLVLFLAGLQDIEPALYEAASLDGATAWQRFHHITVPGLNHVIVLVTITQLIASFQIFGQVYIMTKGGPGTATEVVIQHIYEAGFKNYELGYAATVSVFLFVVMAAVSAIQFRISAKDA